MFGRRKPIGVGAFVKGHEVVIRVQDEGIGLSEQDQERVFNRFESVRAKSDHKGLGLGLWITKRIVEAHGGTMFVESELGKGSVFIIRLPLQAN
ncbi:MAG: sensor histidine kinase [Candidatus Binataceae bacterium]